MDDPIRDTVLKKIKDKYDAGSKEHGNKGLAEAGFTRLQNLQNLQEELIDAVMYIENEIQRELTA